MIMGSSIRVFFYLAFLTVTTFGNCFCIESERQALLHFKQDLKDPSNKLSSWAGEDCCQWFGVVCDNFTGHVLEINLGNFVPESNETYSSSQLVGKINPSLVNLTHLTLLDLRHNDFEGRPIPSFIGSIKSLRFLELSCAGFGGVIPHQLGNLSMLNNLCLEDCHQSNLRVEGLEWLSGLSSLRILDMDWINLSTASDHWLQVINTLPSLELLSLFNCQLNHIPPTLTHVNLTSLLILQLYNNHFDSQIPEWVSSLVSLSYLNIMNSSLKGPIPESIASNCSNLGQLILGSNHLEGPLPLIPYSVSFLDLSNNSFSGSMDNFLCGGMEKPNSLEFLILSDNLLSGGIPDCWFMKWQHLKFIKLDNNNLMGNIPSSMGYLPSLTSLRLRNNHLSGELPVSLQNWISFLCN